MRKYIFGLALTLSFPCASWAVSWSSCQTITAVTNYVAYSQAVSVILSPGIPGCTGDAPGAANFRVGELGVTADSLKSLFATITTAHLTGNKVMILYDGSTASCYASAISVGGYAAQCP